MRQAVKLPMRIHFLLTSQTKAVELSTMLQIAGCGFDRSKAEAIADVALGTVDGLFHPPAGEPSILNPTGGFPALRVRLRRPAPPA